MCGICGIATRDPARPVDADTIRRMTDVLVHRGPDGEGTFVAPGIGLGVRRLAIVDLETGDQPIANEDGTVVVVCNGEIYNHVELRAELERAGHHFRTQSDVETIAHLYEDLGLDCLHRLRGMFALALWDVRRARLVLARDRLGIKPLVWARTREGIAFGSEFKALLAGRCIEAALDPAAVDELFSWGWVVTPRSACAGVSRLPAGHLLVWEDGRERVTRWYTLPLLEPGDSRRRSEEEWAEGLLARLEDAVRVHLRADVPVGVWLSGGIDSSAVAALAARILGRTVDAFSLEFEDPRYNEIGTVRTLDRFPGYDLRAHRILFDGKDARSLLRGVWHGEELASSGNLRQRIALLTASRVKVALAGEGSDEVLCGYWWYQRDRRLRFRSRLYRARDRWWKSGPRLGTDERTTRLAAAAPGPGPEPFQALAGPAGSEGRREFYSQELSRALEANPARLPRVPAELRNRDPVEWLQYWDLTTRMQDHIVHGLDRHTMSHSIEVRVPFLDHEVAEWCLAIPPRLKRARREKRVLRRAMARDLPPEIRDRKKRGLAGPQGDWLGPSPPRFVAELLSPEGLRAKGWFDPPRVARAWEEHRAGGGRRSPQLQSVLRVQLWDEIFVRGRSLEDFDSEPVA